MSRRKRVLAVGVSLVGFLILFGANVFGQQAIVPGCILCQEQPCCTTEICPLCSVTCANFLAVVSENVWVAIPGPWDPNLPSDPQLCYTQYVCVSMGVVCGEGSTEWLCMPDFTSGVTVMEDPCYEGSWCLPKPGPGPGPGTGG